MKRDRIAGILLGLAAGDQNGGPIRMAVRLAESLADCGGVHLDDIAQRYLVWWREGAFDTGPTAARVLELVDSGLSFETASHQVHLETGGQTAGCNPAHRSAPLAMLPNVTTTRLAEFAAKEAALTHRHPLAGDVAAAVALTCNQLAKGASWKEAIELASAERQPLTQQAMTRSERPLDRGGFATDVLAAAIHFLETSDSFELALKRSFEFAGRANYCPVLVGSLGGARWGANGISYRILNHCEILPRVQAAANNLASLWADD